MDHLTTASPEVLIGVLLATVLTGYAAWRAVSTATGAARRQLKGRDSANLLTYLAASIATAVSAQGMWRFFRDVLHVEPFLRVGMFGFLEVAVLASAVRVRRGVLEHRGAGIDGAAVWALTTLTGTLSALHAESFAEAVFRLAAPLVAAWLWERGIGAERRARTGQTGIQWTITPERLLVRLGLAEPSGRTTEQAQMQRLLIRLAAAAELADRLQSTGGRRARRAQHQFTRALQRTVARTDLATSPAANDYLLRHLGALRGAGALLAAETTPPWGPAAGGPETETETETTQPRPSAPRPVPDPDPRSPAPSVSEIRPEPQPETAQVPIIAEPRESSETAPGPRNARPADPKDWTDEQILADIRERKQTPSINAMKTLYRIGFDRARDIKRQLPIQKLDQPVTEPDSDQRNTQREDIRETATVDHFLHTPMQQS